MKKKDCAAIWADVNKALPISYPPFPIHAVAIGCSTGGPQALATLFKHLAHATLLHQPIFITQHLPATFTTILAKHLEQLAGRSCMEATDGLIVKPDNIYVAQGDYHLVPAQEKDEVVLHLTQEPQVNCCRPAVDPMLEALSGIYGSHLLAIILTGMGNDGLGGCRKVLEAGGTVIAQDEQSSVVWDMPKAVAEQNLCSAILPLDEMVSYILKACI